MSNEKWITIGQIINTQGLRGEVKVLPLTSFLERFQDLDEVLIVKDENHMATLRVEKARLHKQKFMIIKFKGLDSINDVEIYKQAYMMVTHENTVPLPEGHYFIFDIIGLDVYTTKDEYLGKIIDVITTSNDVYVIRRPEGDVKKDILLPATKEVVREINIEQGRMIVHLLPGLIGD